MTDRNSRADAQIERILPDAIALRHHLHRHPELSGGEQQTAAYVAERLRPLGLDTLETGVGGHGIVAALRGAHDGPTVALRADMDALPIQEQSECEYRSKVPGVMHACGHDGHTACLWGAAAMLAAMREDIHGTVKFFFQPAEETTGGAEALCAAGVMDDVDAIFALHGWPGMDAGKIGLRAGPLMASADKFEIVVRGQGGHAAYPHLTVDPIVAGAQIVLALQTVASREMSPLEPVVVTVAQFTAGTAYNVIPGEAQLAGTVRCLSNRARTGMRAIIERIVAGICQALRAEYSMEYVLGPPVTMNDARLTEFVEAIGGEILGVDSVEHLDAPSMGAEDFAYYLSHAPGAMLRLGVGANASPLHTPTYDFGDEAVYYGVHMLAGLGREYGKRNFPPQNVS